LKSRFRFFFVSKRILFGEIQHLKAKLKGTLTPRKSSIGLLAKQLDMNVLIEIEPSITEDPNRFPDGELCITLPGEPDESVFMARILAHSLAEHLFFFYGDFKIAGGMQSAERIPENDEEAKLIGDDKYWVQLNLEEVPPPTKFDRKILSLFPSSLTFQRTIQQYNIAKESKNPIDQFLGMFKVIETQFHIGKKKARETLMKSSNFCNLVRKNIKLKKATGKVIPMSEGELTQFVNTLICIRDKCAHLREHNQFGYAPYDPEVFEEVKPYGDLIESLARESLIEKYREGKRDLFDFIF
jgi:hypothetical protein